ncbi:MAG: hypothetical protein PHN75_14445 [Syntrophales bacterium]|nr:hypothetical protein [Syntrophales bacterium]
MNKKLIKILLCIIIVSTFASAWAIWDLDRTYDSGPVGVELHKTDRCPRSAALVTEPVHGPWYPTVTPNEAFVSERTHTFPYTCTIPEQIGPADRAIKTRTIAGLPGIYNVVTRNRGEIFVLGGATKSTESCAVDGETCATGPYVAKVDARTLKVLWKTQIHDAKRDGDWDYPGAIGIHGNGYVYVINGYHLAKIDPADGKILKLAKMPVPEGRNPGDTVYNGFSILSDGRLIAKSMTREAGSKADSINALLFHYDSAVPSVIAVIDPVDLKLATSLTVKEPVLGRITNTVFNHVEYIYVSGFKNIFRYIYKNQTLSLDDKWGPVPYCFYRQKPATAPAILGDFVIVQTNFQLASAPLTLTAVSQADAAKVFRIAPFTYDGWLPGSLQWSLPTIDVENSRIYAYDFLEGKLAAIDFQPKKGFSIAWKANQRSLSFAALVGPKNNRTLVLDDVTLPSVATVRVIWRDAKTGRELAKSPLLPQGWGLPIAPGFDGVMYYPSHKGMLTELSF